MDTGSKRLFLLLVVAQALHSLEEFRFELWESLAFARAASGLISADLATGFAVVNVAFVALGVLAWLIPVRQDRASAIPIAWFFVVVELANGAAHLLLALGAGGYFPGVITAPLLLLAAGLLARRLSRRGTVDRSSGGDRIW